MTANDRYDKKIFKITMDSARGDKTTLRLPIKAAKRLIGATGKLPVAPGKMEGIELTELMEAVAACLDEEMEGDIVAVDGADGSRIRIFVE